MYQVQRKISTPNFCLSTVKLKLDKYGSQHIIIIRIASLIIVHNIKEHVPFFLVTRYFVFLADGPFTCTTIFNCPDKSNVFKG